MKSVKVLTGKVDECWWEKVQFLDMSFRSWMRDPHIIEQKIKMTTRFPMQCFQLSWLRELYYASTMMGHFRWRWGSNFLRAIWPEKGKLEMQKCVTLMDGRENEENVAGNGLFSGHQKWNEVTGFHQDHKISLMTVFAIHNEMLRCVVSANDFRSHTSVQFRYIRFIIS